MKKKIIFSLLLLICFMPIVKAESCKVVTGDGRNIGDEVACGTEHFYVISNDGENVDMLGKYNLYVGTIMDIKTFITAEEMKQAIPSDDWYCYESSSYYGCYLNNSSYYNDIDCWKQDDETWSCNWRTEIEEDKVLQNSAAIGAHGDEKGEPAFPEVGITYLSYFETDDDENIILSSSVLAEYLSAYEKSLGELEIPATNVRILTLSDLLSLVDNINEEEIDWDSVIESMYNDDNYIGDAYRFSLLPYIQEKYNWIYQTTYWLGTADRSNGTTVYFVDTLGDLCSTYNWCTVDYEIGAGIRPLITIADEEIYREPEEIEEVIVPNTNDQVLTYVLVFMFSMYASILLLKKLKKYE